MIANNASEYAQVLDVTPTLASTWLDNKALNRPVDQGRVNRYARLMTDGKWRVTDQGIGFGTDGKLYDGEHRLWAVIESKCTVRMLVVFNLTEDARKAIDTGKGRRSYDVLHMFAHIPNARHVTGWCNAVSRLVFDSTPVLSAEDAEAWYYAVKPDIEFGFDAYAKVPTKLRRALAPVAVLGALVFAHRKAPAQVREFAERYASGEGLHTGDPAHTLREFLLADDVRGDSRTARLISLKTLRAAQLAAEGKKITKLQSGEEGLRYFVSAHAVTTLPPPVLSSNGGKVSAQDAGLYEQVKHETSLSKLVQKLKQGGLAPEGIPAWCVRFQRFLPYLLQYPPSEVERMAAERLAGQSKKGRE